jgi:AcrR family transcriptional regulator
MPKTVSERADIIPVLGETFRRYGFEGASLSLIGKETGLGKGSLYHFFPGGKEEMAAAVLGEIGDWFTDHVYRPLREAESPDLAISEMCASVRRYFDQGKRVCLVGAFALDNVRDRFSDTIRNYFRDWQDALSTALQKAGAPEERAEEKAEAAILGIQGALVLARALNDPLVFDRAMARIERDLKQA